MIIKRCALVLLMLLSASALAMDTLSGRDSKLPESLQLVFKNFAVPDNKVGIYVREVGAVKPLLSVNPQLAFNPASTIKLVTTWLALEELGPAYTWPTDVHLDGELRDGVLQGNLIIKGFGDPYFITESMWLLQRQLQLRGLRHINGDLLIDNSYFVNEYGDAGEFDDEPLRIYNVLPDAFLVNFQAVRYFFTPAVDGKTVQVAADPLPANLHIDNRLTTRGGYCGGYLNGVSVQPADNSVNDRMVLSGRYPRDCKEYSLTRSVLTAPSYAYGVFRTLWEQTGGTLEGGWRIGLAPQMPKFSVVQDGGAIYSGPQPFVRMNSPPLADVIRYINKYSNNVMARHLFLTMGAQAYGAPANLQKAREAASVALVQRGLDFPELYLDNGAGLSRDARIAAGSLAQVLELAAGRPWAAEFISSLALAGLDGTLRKRFVEEDLTGQMHLKTGRLKNVYATAGYVHARSGRDYVVVILQNYNKADNGPGEEAQTALLRWVYEQ
jgi:serine-type D-Ala-D-Ala carboxypeptidase/endopeptidase (penicillin-binding protein 4)